MKAEQPACDACGASVRAEDEWCPRCLTPREAARRIVPPDAYGGPLIGREHSRAVKTDISYGLWGRIVATVLLCVVPVVVCLVYFFPIAFIWIVFAWPLLLRSIWKKAPVHRPS